MAVPVKIEGTVQIVGKTFRTPRIVIPGIPGAVLYTAGDAFGTKFSFDVPYAGTIEVAVMLDKDDEGIETDLVLFTEDFTEIADNAAFDLSDADLEKFLSTISFATFKNFGLNQSSTAAAIGLAYIAPQRKLWAQMVTRGGPTIAAGVIPEVRLTIINAVDS